MCACTAASVEDAANNLLEELNSGAKCLCVEHDASDDVAPALLRAARARVEAGSNVRVVCADAVAAARFRALAADDPLLGALDVVSVRELALSILGDARVGDAVGRDARVLDENELAVLMEDVKVSGLKPGRLREMLSSGAAFATERSYVRALLAPAMARALLGGAFGRAAALGIGLLAAGLGYLQARLAAAGGRPVGDIAPGIPPAHG